MKKLYTLLFAIMLFAGIFTQNANAQFSVGSGTPEDPYQISTPADLKQVHLNATRIVYYKQMNNIDLTAYLAVGGDGYTTYGWYPIGGDDLDGPFGGVYDGDNHIITGLTTTGRSQSGLFGYIVNGAEIKNLGIEIGSVSGDCIYVGGFVGLNEGTITNCFSKVSVTGISGNFVGGLVGYNSGIITNCYATGDVFGMEYAGGLVGSNYGPISDSYSTSFIRGDREVGGLVGNNNSSITNCNATGDVVGMEYTGGLVGYNHVGAITNCYSKGNVRGHMFTGGLVGTNYGPISYSYSTSYVRGDMEVGGLVGNNNNSITNCNTTGDVEGMQNAGGLVGINYGPISNSYSTSYVRGDREVGGLVGTNSATITTSFATGTVEGMMGYTGGLVGQNAAGSITNCYSTGAVRGWENKGGLVGYNNTTISYCYATGLIDYMMSMGSTGGLVGQNDIAGTINYGYWDINTTSQTTSAGSDNAYGKTTANMNLKETYENWDYATPIWEINPAVNGGYPYFAWQNIPPPPIASAASDTTVNSFTAKWTAPKPATKYYLDVATDNGFTSLVSGYNNLDVGNVLSYDITGLSAGINYYYRVRADYASVMSSNSLSIAVTTMQSQSITFTLSAVTYGATPFAITASGGASGNPVTFTSSDNTVATCTGTNGETLTLLKVAPVNIYANQAGNATYAIATQVSQALTINKKVLTVTGSNANKVYDGTTIATITGATLVGAVGSDLVTIATPTGTFASAVASTGISVTPTLTLTGLALGNYTLTQPTLTANITAKPVIINGVTAATKTYDGNNTAILSGGVVCATGIGTETLTFTDGTGIFVDQNVGTKAVTATGYALTDGTNGGLATNYSLSAQPAVADQSITAKEVSITEVTATTKAYDGNNTAILSDGIVITGVGNETLTITAGTGTFADQNVGTKAVTASTYALADGTNGELASNYTLSAQPVVADQAITAKSLTITGVTADTKVYDGDNTATLSGGVVCATGLGSETLTFIAGTGTFVDKNVGSKAVTAISYALADGTNGGLATNYTLLAQPIVASQDITAKTLTVTANAGSKTYGDVNPVLTITCSGFAGSESATSLTTSPTATTTATQLSDVNSYSIVPDGGVSANYTFKYVNGTLTVNKASLDVTADNASRNNGEANPSFTLSYTGFKGTDGTSVIDLLPTATTTANISSAAADYDIILAGGSDNNYDLVLHKGILTVTTATAISTTNAMAISVYPNPARDYIYINNVPLNTNIRIYNVQGLLVKNSVSSNATEKIEIDGLHAGIYIIHLSGKEIESTTHVVIQ